MLAKPSVQKCSEPPSIKCKGQRRRQKTYRARAKTKDSELTSVVQRLRKRNELLEMFRDLLLQRTLLSPTHLSTLRLTQSQLYCDAFRYGAPLLQDDPSAHARHHEFLGLNIANNLTVVCTIPIHNIPAKIQSNDGPSFVNQYYEGFTMLHGRLQQICQGVFMDGTNAVLLHIDITLPITYQYIQAMYPHMLTDGAFMQQVIGKSLAAHNMECLSFDECGKISHVSVTHDLFASWYSLLQDHNLVQQVMGLASNAAILFDEEVVDSPGLDDPSMGLEAALV